MDKDGVSVREHLKQVQKQTGTPPKELLGPIPPVELRYVWSIFLSLHGGRRYSEHGPDALSYSEIKAWCDLCHEDLTIWELDIVKRIDTTFLSVASERG